MVVFAQDAKKPWVQSPVPHKRSTAAQPYSTSDSGMGAHPLTPGAPREEHPGRSTQEREAERSEVPSPPQLQGKLKATLGYIRPSSKLLHLAVSPHL